jgi:putative membrane protein
MLADLLPTLNALLNASCAALLVAGFVAIRRGRRDLHRRLMYGALGTSALFLASYLTRVALTGTHRYPGTGLARTIYLTVLATHTVLAALVVPLVLWTVHLAAVRQRFQAHRRIARITLPIWLYVSVTGVAVYLMLYQLAGI